ncbi:tRNA(Ser) Um(44) 2'-O-methyltransferase [Elasticomyces elasticus]|nr:tRNA(Ser) Um(44) 2'-O-methyltransferase [Elasticomyces elasticus]
MGAGDEGEKFSATDLSPTPPIFMLPDELWISALSTQCTFPPEIFLRIMLNLISNPNFTSSHLFRADIFYDSLNDVSVSEDPTSEHFSDITKHLKPDYRPRSICVPGYTRQRTFVRELIPRNPQLDKPLLQTCHIYSKQDHEQDDSLVVYVPHVTTEEEIPWYHPPVRSVAFLHVWRPAKRLRHIESTDSHAVGTAVMSLHISPFSCMDSLPHRLHRTLLNLLRILHKHGQGQLSGYVKRSNHDQIVSQKAFQDTYTRLKIKYAKQLTGNWVEQTDPSKHVFEDLGIAAFLIEVWTGMYGRDSEKEFPGFVDVGCGNGVLVYVLLQEGYKGYGFDARARKTWSTFPEHVSKNLQEMILVPEIFEFPGANGPVSPDLGSFSDVSLGSGTSRTFHNGVFEPGTFIISNHADELTTWTPLLAYLNEGSFIAIPCCSHNLAGARFRVPTPPSLASPKTISKASAQVNAQDHTASSSDSPFPADSIRNTQAVETGSLAISPGARKIQSAYALLCAYLERLTTEVGFVAEREMLRIPSTRNACIVGRNMQTSAIIAASTSNVACEGDSDENGMDGMAGYENGDSGMKPMMAEGRDARRERVTRILERELGMSARLVGKEWVERAEKIAGKKGDGH